MPKRKSDFQVRFWGVRGSLPTPGPDTCKYGGNTSCVEVRCGDDIIVVDLGSGARPLGVALSHQAPVHVTCLISHYHWDHICGIPFCGIFYDPRNSFDLWGEGRKDKGLRSILAGQMRYPYFPVGLDVFQSTIRYNTLCVGDVIKTKSAVIKTAALNHPQSCVAYRIEYKGKAVVYCSDNEHQDEMPDDLAALLEGADLLIYDAAYTDDEYSGRTGSGSKIGWGHSTWDEAIRHAKLLHVKKLFIFHHDPMHTDAVIDRLLRECRRRFKELHASREGLTVTLD